MAHIRISDAARDDLQHVLLVSLERWGSVAAHVTCP